MSGDFGVPTCFSLVGASGESSPVSLQRLICTGSSWQSSLWRSSRGGRGRPPYEGIRVLQS